MEPTSSPPLVPPEVWDLVLSNFSTLLCVTGESRDIKKVLSSFALVCRVWRELVRQYQFEFFHCKFDIDDYSEMAVKAVGPPRTLTMIRDFLNSSPIICFTIKRLRLDLTWSKHDQLTDSVRRGYDCFNPYSDPMILAEILRLLPRLRDLDLSNISFERCPSDMPPTPVSSGLRFLSIGQQERLRSSIQGTFNLLRLFTGVEQLILHDMTWAGPNSTDNEPGPITPLPMEAQFTSLWLQSMSYTPYLLSAIEMYPDSFPLRSLNLLRVELDYGRGILSLTSLLHALGPKLEHIWLDLQVIPVIHHRHPDELTYLHAMDLSRCTNLCSLSFLMDICTKAIPDSHLRNPQVAISVPDSLVAILSSAPLSLRTITFVVPSRGWDLTKLEKTEEHGWIDLTILEGDLLGRTERGLRKVIFSSALIAMNARDEAVIRTALPRLHAMGVVEICFEDVFCAVLSIDP